MKKIIRTFALVACLASFSANADLKDSMKLILSEDRPVKWKITDALENFKGQSITLILSSGKEVSGKLSSAKIQGNPGLVYLTEISDMSYFGSLILLSDIVGIKFRNQK